MPTQLRVKFTEKCKAENLAAQMVYMFRKYPGLMRLHGNHNIEDRIVDACRPPDSPDSVVVTIDRFLASDVDTIRHCEPHIAEIEVLDEPAADRKR